METSYIITFIGDDRPGLVGQLSTIIENNRGNWLQSRLSQLGGKFAGLILVTLPDADGASLEADLKALSAAGLSVRVTPTTAAAGTPAAASAAAPLFEGRGIVLTVIGPDRLGIVREVSRALAERDINVVEMDSHVVSAAMSAEMIFKARIDAHIPEQTDLDDLQETLDDIANTMTLEIDLEPASL